MLSKVLNLVLKYHTLETEIEFDLREGLWMNLFTAFKEEKAWESGFKSDLCGYILKSNIKKVMFILEYITGGGALFQFWFQLGGHCPPSPKVGGGRLPPLPPGSCAYV